MKIQAGLLLMGSMMMSSTVNAMDIEQARKLAGEFLQSTSFEIEKVTSGWSGANVFKITKGSEKYLLKADPKTPNDQWKQRLAVQHFVSQHKLSPEVLFSDTSEQAVLSRYIEDKGVYSAYLGNFQLDQILEQMVKNIKLLHGLKYSGSVPEIELLAFLQSLWKVIKLETLPAFVQQAISDFEKMPLPEKDRKVLSHCDLNTSNILFDGASVFFVDWDNAARIHPFYDVATIATYFSMDEKNGERLLEIYEGDKVSANQREAFRYYRIGSYIVNGSMFLVQAGGVLPSTQFGEVPRLNENFAKLGEGKLNLNEIKGFQELALSFFKEAKLLMSNEQ